MRASGNVLSESEQPPELIFNVCNLNVSMEFVHSHRELPSGHRDSDYVSPGLLLGGGS